MQHEFPGLMEAQGLAVPDPLLFRNLSGGSPMTIALPTAPSAYNAEMELMVAVETAKLEARRETEMALQQEMERRVHAERANVANALDTFVSEKRRYFSGLEKEVVRLALAIAERVLHRESSMDPTLLAAAARVALEQVDQDSSAVLLVAPLDAGNWHSAMASIGREVQLREDPSLERGQCLLQTQAGSFELGVRAQLCEIERGFFELLGRSPAVPA